MVARDLERRRAASDPADRRARGPDDSVDGRGALEGALTAARRLTILFISQVYPPDPAAVGQQLADAAAELVSRGHRVRVLTADAGYDDPTIRYARREIVDGVEVHRLRWSSFGKRSMALRLLGGLVFLLQATVLALFMRDLDRMVLTTVPLTSAAAGALLSLRRRVAVVYWVMDLNPDQLVALGVLSAGAWPVRALDTFNRALLRRAAAVIVLDRFMAARVRRKFDPGPRLHIVPPWAHDRVLELVPHTENPFRRAHGMDGKRVVMYSGNHALSNPIGTILDAAARVTDDERLVFAFVGGGVGKREVEAKAGPNVRSLPYQPLDRIKYSLSAADVHVATIGDRVVGIVHPCKVYGAMALGRPVLSVGPADCHLADLARHGIGWHIATGDVDGAERLLRDIAGADAETLRAMGERGRQLAAREFASVALRRRLCDLVDGTTATP